MKFFIPAFIAGAVLNIFVLSADTGIEIRARWTGHIRAMETVEPDTDAKSAAIVFPVWTPEMILYVDGNGAVKESPAAENSLLSMSGDGRFFARYEKVGSSVELLNWNGERFWKVKLREYPYLSYSGRLILFMNADHSRIRFLDHNGIEVGQKEISGRFCTAVAFSSPGDAAAAGFLDGTYYFMDGNGALLFSGRTAPGTAVKSAAVSPGGLFGAIHYGGGGKDSIAIIDIKAKNVSTMPLRKMHVTRIGLGVTDGGRVTVLDGDSIVQADDDGDEIFSIKIKPARMGFSAVRHDRKLTAVSYTMTSGEAAFYLFNDEGNVLLSKEFPAESFLDCGIKGGLILLRGSDNLYCYSIHRGPSE